MLAGFVRRRRGPRQPGRRRARRWPRAPAHAGRPIVRACPSPGIRTERRSGHRGRSPTAATSSARPSCSPPGCGPASSARRCGIDVPLQAAEHYYLLTEPIDGRAPRPAGDRGPGPLRLLPRGGRRPARRAVRARWPRRGSSTGRRADFAFGSIAAGLGPDDAVPRARRCRATRRWPTSACASSSAGRSSFTPDLHPMLGPAPEVDGVYVAAGLNSLGILLGGGVGSVVAQWIVDGRRTGRRDRTTRSSGRCRTRRRGGSAASAIARVSSGVLFGDGAWPTLPVDDRARRPALGAARPAGRRRRAVRPVRRLGVPAVVRRPRRAHPGTAPRPLGPAPRPSTLVAAEHRAVREAVGVMDMSLMSKFRVAGPGRRRRAEPAVGQRRGRARSARVVYTQWCDVDGGILADLTVTRLADDRFLVVVQRRDPPPGARRCSAARRARRGRDHHRRDRRDDAALGAGPACRASCCSRCHPTTGPTTAFPYLTAREIEVGSSGVLALRVTYVGELGYELHVPADQGASVWEAPRRGRRRRTACGRSACSRWASLRLEKGYRDYGVDIENTDDPLVAGLGLHRSRGTSPAGSSAARRCCARRDDRGRAHGRTCCSTTRSRCCTAASRCCSTASGSATSAPATTATRSGASVGLAVVEHEAGVTADWLQAGGFEVDVAGTRVPATLSLRPFYDPDRLRIRS